jgi:hypothetical protein
LSIVACLSVAVATVVNTCHIAYSMHVTIRTFFKIRFLVICIFFSGGVRVLCLLLCWASNQVIAITT